MSDPGAIRLSAMLDASPFLGGISGMVGGLSKMSNAMKLGSLAVGYFAFKTLKEATKELVAFEMQALELKKVMGGEIAEPVIQSVRELSLVMPVAREQLMNVAATAARLGIRGRENILKFTEVVAKIGIATDVSAEQAAESLARLAKQTGMPISDMEGLGAAINQLDNTMATSSAGIIDAASRSAAELSRLGFTVPEIISLNAALAEVSESASRAGTRLNMLAQEFGNPKKAEHFGKAIGMTGDAFTKLRREMPLEALLQLVDVMRDGGDVADELASNVNSRVRRALQQFAVNEEGLTHALKEGNLEFIERNSLNREYGEALQLVNSKQVILKNNVDELQTKIGEGLRPAIISIQEAAIAATQALNWLFTDPLKGTLTNKQLENLRGQLYALWADDSKMHQYFGNAMDHANNLIWILSAGQVELGTWHRANQVYQEDISKMMASISSGEMRPIFFMLLNEAMEEAWQKSVPLEEVMSDLWELSKEMDKIDLSSIVGDKMAFYLFEQQSQKVIAAYQEKVITEKQFIRGMQFAADAAKLNAKTYNDKTDAIRRGVLADQDAKDAIDKKIKSLEEEIQALTMTRLERLKLTDEWKNATLIQRQEMQEGVMRIEQLEKEAVAANELAKAKDKEAEAAKAKIQSWKDQVADMKTELWIRTQVIQGIQSEARARYEAEQIRKWGLGQRHQDAMAMYDEIVARDAVIDSMKEEGDLAEKQATDAEKRQEKIKALIDKYTFATFESQLRMFERIVGDTADGIIDTFEALVTGADDAGQAIMDMFKDIARMLIQMQLQRLLFNTFGPLLFPKEFAGLGNTSTNFDIGEMSESIPRLATGGTLDTGQLAVVGEKGPELFLPRSAGTIIPNESFGGGELHMNVTYNIQALDSASVRQMLTREQDTIAGLAVDKINRHRTMKRM